MFDPNLERPGSSGNGNGKGYSPSQTPGTSYVTIYLDGQMPPAQNRAINRNIAIAGHDYYEVAFYHPNSSTIARAAWELTKPAVISGVQRNVDYGHPYDPGLYDPIDPGRLQPGDGAAILFVGKKTDKTLLGIGVLYGVDNGSGLELSTVITADTKSVTFKVSALKAGVYTAAYATPYTAFTSFLTAALAPETADPRNDSLSSDPAYVGVANTNVLPFSIGDGAGSREFPIFKLDKENPDTYAKYTFALDVTSSSPEFDDYAGALYLAGDIHFEKQQPRYPVIDGGFQGYSLRLDNETVITPRNNIYVPLTAKYFENPIELSFNTVGSVNGSVFSLMFQVPIYPISAEDNPGTWYIRASYDSSWLDLDDGLGINTGGAVLIRVGDAEYLESVYIKILDPPDKWLYDDNTNGKEFNINGLVVWLYDQNDEPIRVLTHDELSFILGGDNIVPGNNISGALTGVQTVLVNFYDNGITHTDMFSIVIVEQGSGEGVIPPHHFFVIPDDYDVSSNDYILWGVTRMVEAGGSGTYVIVATKSFDFPGFIQLPANITNVNVLFVAAKLLDRLPVASGAGVTVIGKSNTNGYALTNWVSSNSFYFGLWPDFFSGNSDPGGTYDFEITDRAWPRSSNDPITGYFTGNMGYYKTHPFVVNARGSQTHVVRPSSPTDMSDATYVGGSLSDPVTNPSPPATAGVNYFLTSTKSGEGEPGRVYNVLATEGQDLRIVNRRWLN